MTVIRCQSSGLPPCSNRRLVATADGLKRRKGVSSWQTGFGLAARLAMRTAGLAEPLDGDVVAVIVFNLSPKRRRDIDSGIKDTLDALSGHVWNDDRQVKALCVLLEHSGDSTTVLVTPAGSNAAAALAQLVGARS